MAHRGPLRETFGLICMTVLFRQSEKAPEPIGNTGYIMDTIDVIIDDGYPNLTVPLSTVSYNTGCLSSFITFMLSAVSILGNEAISMIAYPILISGLLLLMRVLKRSTVVFIASAYRRVINGAATHNTHHTSNDIDESSPSTPFQATTAIPDGPTNGDKIDESSRSTSQATTAPSGDDDEWASWFDAEETQTSGDDDDEWALWFDAEETQTSTAETQRALARLQTSMDRLGQRNDNLMSNLRNTLDPTGLYSPHAHIAMIANDVTRDLRRVSRKVDRQKEELNEARARQENGQLVEKDGQIVSLSAEVTRLKGRVFGLELGQLSSVAEVKNIEQKANERVQRLKERAVEAERRAAAAVSQSSYDNIKDQLTTVAEQLREAEKERKDAVNAQGLLTTQLRDEEARTAELQAIADDRAKAQQQSEDLLTSRADELELANSNIADLETEILKKIAEVQAAEERVEEERLKQSQQRTEPALKESKAEPTENYLNEDLATEVDRLRSQLSGAFHNGFLQGLAKNSPDDRAQELSETEAHTNALVDSAVSEERQQAQKRLDTAVAETKQTLQASSEEVEARTKVLVENAVSEERQRAQKRLDTAVAETKQTLQASSEEVEARAKVLVDNAVSQEKLEAQKQLDTAVEQAVKRVKAEAEEAWRGKETEWTACLNSADAAFRELQAARDSMDASASSERDRANQAENQANEAGRKVLKESTRANEAERKATEESHRAQVAEGQLQKYQTGKVSQDGRIKGYLEEIASLKRKIPQNADLNAAELDATMGDRARAHAILDEYCNRSYDYATRELLKKLFQANARILELKRVLKDPRTKPNRLKFLKALQGAKIDKQLYMQLDQPNRQVMVKQCRAVNAKLDDLKTIINASESDTPSIEAVLMELYKRRGDETAEWFDDDPSEPSSDEDDDKSSVRSPAPRERRLPVSRRMRPAVPQAQDTQLPSDPRANNLLKRKDNDDDLEGGAAGKRRDASEEDMRPVRPQQGSSSSKAADDLMETKSESQTEQPASERIVEASAPQQQSNDPIDVSARLPGAPSLASQHFTSADPSPSSETPSQIAHAPHPKHTMISGPKPKAHLTASERQQRLRYKQYPESEASSAQEAAASPSTQGPTTFSFSMPKDVASGILPHVRRYTQLSGKTNKVLSRHPPNASTAERQYNLQRTITARPSDGG